MTTILTGDCREVLKTLPDESVQCCVTSPPYWGLRDYGVEGQLGLEKTPEQYVANMVQVFREVRRVLRKDGTLWLNLGDSYGGGNGGNKTNSEKQKSNQGTQITPSKGCGMPKQLCGIPWRVAFALQADGWYLRQDIIWHKPNPMPESVTDRCTKAHEYIFLLTKSAKYYYDQEAIKEEGEGYGRSKWNAMPYKCGDITRNHGGKGLHEKGESHSKWTVTPTFEGGRNKRSVWTVPTSPYAEAHFATFPPDLIRPCILAGSSIKCCPSCGVAWERDIEDTPEYAKFKADERKRKGTGMRGGNELETYGLTRGTSNKSIVKETITLGFSTACDCGRTDSVPSTVLDPFGGSGTVGLVATEYGRKSILIELNPAYVKLAEQRTNITPSML